MGDVAHFHQAGDTLPQLRFGAPIRLLTEGSHHPLLASLENDQGPAGQWVVKPLNPTAGDGSRSAFPILAEIVAAEVCALMGIKVPSMGIVRFPSAAEDASVNAAVPQLTPEERTEIKLMFQTNRGQVAFCSRYLDGAINVVARTLRRRPAYREIAATLLAVDIFLLHDDRRPENPNTLWFDSELVAIDHGNAFAGLASRGATPHGVAARTVPQWDIRRHICFALASGLPEEKWREIGARLEALDTRTIAALLRTCPVELDVDRMFDWQNLRREFEQFIEARQQEARKLCTLIRERSRKA